MSYKTLSLEQHEMVQIVRLSRPKVNAMNKQFFLDMKNCFLQIKTNKNIRSVVIISSNPKIFTAGLDLKDNLGFPGSNTEIDAARASIIFQAELQLMQDAFTAIEECDKPVIVGINGICIGGGIDLITACDIRFCTKDTLFSVREVDVGLAADLGTLQRLPNVCGNQSWVRDICLTARDFLSKEALEFGLVSKVYENYEELVGACLKIAVLIAAKPPLATFGTKHVLNYSVDHTVKDGLQYMQVWNSVMLNSPDTMNAAMCALSRKTGVYSKL
jgi:delta(3,5)-delta(2,4)-dienoyl-CoA isomerase